MPDQRYFVRQILTIKEAGDGIYLTNSMHLSLEYIPP